MKDLNDVMIIGRLVSDAKLEYFQSGSAYSKITIANNRTKKTNNGYEDEANFFDVSIFGKTAENLNKYLTKGSQVVIHGELKQDRWEKDGQKSSRVVIVANEIQLVGGRSNNNGSNASVQDIPPQVNMIQQTFNEDIPF